MGLSFRLASLQDFNPENIFTREIQDIVDRTLESLPDKTREIFRASRIDNKSYKEIAQQYGITVKGVEFHITKSNKALRDALKDYLPLWVLLFYFPWPPAFLIATSIQRQHRRTTNKPHIQMSYLAHFGHDQGGLLLVGVEGEDVVDGQRVARVNDARRHDAQYM